jgi:3-oxoacyl-[acyl-carrier protein] reductase
VDLGIAGKVGLVTASSKGLGRASALALAAEGVRLVINARREGPLRETEGALLDAGADVHAVVGDVTEPDMPARLATEARERFGGIDIVVANAGGPPPARALDVTDDQLEAAVNANFTTSVRLIRAAVPIMKERGWGRICCITSFSIKQPIPHLALSNLARTGLWAWAKTAAVDLFPSGITLNLACPGGHATDRMVELGATAEGLGDPADFGSVVAFLCSKQAGYMTGTAVVVDGGATVGLL